MLIHIQYGIEIDGNLFGWYKKELYKLPSFRKLKQQVNNTSKCYYLNREKYSLKRLKDLTVKINYDINVSHPDDIPF
jgi:hypothetical protein